MDFTRPTTTNRSARPSGASAPTSPTTTGGDCDEAPRVPVGLLRRHGRREDGSAWPSPRSTAVAARGITEASIVLEEIAASGAAMNGCSRHPPVDLRHGPGRQHGTEELQPRCLPRVASGELHVAFGVTEPDAGTDTTRSRTRAVRDGDELHRPGRKVWTTKAPYCEKCLLLVRTTRGGRARSRPTASRSCSSTCRIPAVDITPDPQTRPQRGRVLRGPLRRPARAGQPTASARRARASGTCSTGSTRSAS